MRAFLLIFILSQVVFALPSYTCDEDGYKKYLDDYPSKCEYDSSNCKLYPSCYIVTCRDHLNDWKQSCLDIERKAEYRNYPMSFSILSDFSDEDLEKQMNLGVTYSGEGSYADPEEDAPESWSGDIVGRDMCTGAEEYSVSHPNSTSWASALIFAAEAALRKEGINERLSLQYIMKCLLESQEIQSNDVTPSDMIAFVRERGLMDEAVASQLSPEELCSASAPKFYFDVTRNDIPNKSGLMKFVAEGDPVIVLMALDLVRMKTVNDVTGDDIYTGATDQPSLYGVMKGFDEKKWTVTFNVVPCENIEINLPVVDNNTNANYAGIAGYAMSIKLLSVPPQIISFDVTEKIKEIPSEVSNLRFKHYDPSNVEELTLTYRYLKDLTIDDNAFPIMYYFNVDCPLLRNLSIADSSMSNLALSRRLMEMNGNFILNTPNLMLMTVGIQSLLNFMTMSVTQISSNFTLELGAYELSTWWRFRWM